MDLIGKYEGQLINGEPHGLGRWKRQDGGRVIDGEWKYGLVDGRVFEYNTIGDVIIYEAKKGMYHGKYIYYWNYGNRSEFEWRKGQKHGLQRMYNADEDIVMEWVFKWGQKVEKK